MDTPFNPTEVPSLIQYICCIVVMIIAGLLSACGPVNNTPPPLIGKLVISEPPCDLLDQDRENLALEVRK